jgi:hypothetical protein
LLELLAEWVRLVHGSNRERQVRIWYAREWTKKSNQPPHIPRIPHTDSRPQTQQAPIMLSLVAQRDCGYMCNALLLILFAVAGLQSHQPRISQQKHPRNMILWCLFSELPRTQSKQGSTGRESSEHRRG